MSTCAPAVLLAASLALRDNAAFQRYVFYRILAHWPSPVLGNGSRSNFGPFPSSEVRFT